MAVLRKDMPLSLLCQKLLNQSSIDHGHVADTTDSGPHNITATPEVDPGIQERDRHALLYIVVVLLFYSIGIIIAIITYLKREKAEIEEDKRYEDYMTFRNDPDKWSRYFSVQRMVTHLNNVEAEILRKKQLENQKLAEEAAAARAASEAEDQRQRSIFSLLRRASSDDRNVKRGDKQRFSLIEASLFSSRSRGKDTEDIKKKGKRRWSLSIRKPKGSQDTTKGARSPATCSMPLPEHYEMEECLQNQEDDDEQPGTSSSPQLVEASTSSACVQVEVQSPHSSQGSAQVQSSVVYMTDV